MSTGDRTALQQALQNVAAAQEVLKTAQAAHERAEGEVLRAQERVDAFGNLDERVLAHRVAALKAGSDTALPGELRDQQREKLAALEELQLGNEALQALRDDLDQARIRLADQQMALSAARGNVIFGEASALVSELKAVSERRQHLQLLLAGLNIPDVHFSAIQTFIQDALLENQRPMPLNNSPLTRANEFWKRFGERLQADPTVTLDGIPSLQELWS